MVYMLEEYPQVRCSAADVLDHPWISVSNHIYRVAQKSKPLSNDQEIALNRIKS